MSVSFVVAMDRNRAIGLHNQLPWRLPADLAFFKKLTMGHPILMGRKTHESIGRPLPGRTNVILTQQQGYEASGCEVFHSVEAAIAAFAEAELFVIGGAEIFRLFLPYADKLYITQIEHEFTADTYLPAIDETKWSLTSKEQGRMDENNPYTYYFETYVKNK
jgi:dihydrofolate reductase